MRAPSGTQHLTRCAALPALGSAVTRDAATLADQLGVRIFTADIIYHLFDQFTAYLKQVGPGGGATVLHLCLHLYLLCTSTGVQLAWLAQLSRGQHSTPGTPGAAARALLRPAHVVLVTCLLCKPCWEPSFPNPNPFHTHPPSVCLPAPAGEGGRAGGGQADSRLPLRAEDHPHLHLQPKGMPPLPAPYAAASPWPPTAAACHPAGHGADGNPLEVSPRYCRRTRAA